MTRVYVIEDHPLMRDTIAKLVDAQEGFEVVGRAASGAEALHGVPATDPDLILVDLSMPDLSGDRLIAKLLQDRPALLALMVSGHEESLYADAAIRAGAKGYVMKDDPDEIVQAMRAVARGETYRRA